MNYFDEIDDRFEEAEFLQKSTNKVKIKIENWDLESIEHNNLVSTSLRVKEDRTFGSNYTYGKSNEIMEKLIKGAEKSIKFGKEAQFDFSSDRIDKTSLKTREEYENSNPAVLFDYLQDIMDYIKEKQPDLTLDIDMVKLFNSISMKTSQGGDLKDEISNYRLYIGSPVPGGGSQLIRGFENESMFADIFKEEIDELLAEYNIAREVSVPKTGKLPVLFSPRSLYFVLVSLQAGLSGKKIYQDTSPLIDKKGEKIFSDKIDITDKPHMANSGSRRFFDDEGILTSQSEIIKDGILKSYIYDLEYADKLDAKPTGHGLKKELFSADITTSVSPNFINPVIEPKDKSKNELLSEIDKGIYVTNVIGFHSSNYEQGHFSVQAQGFNVENGKLVGRLQDVMIAGNIYEEFNNVIGVGDKIYPNMWGYAPYILVDKISVTGK